MSSKKHMLQAAAGAGGDTGWIVAFNSGVNSSNLNVTGVATDTNDDIVFVGYQSGHDVIGRINGADGDVISMYGGNSDNRYNGIVTDGSGSFYVYGDRYSYGQPNKHLLRKYNSSLTKQWSYYGQPSSSSAQSVFYNAEYDSTNNRIYAHGHDGSSYGYAAYTSWSDTGTRNYTYAAIGSWSTRADLFDMVFIGSSEVYVGQGDNKGYTFLVNDNYSPSYERFVEWNSQSPVWISGAETESNYVYYAMRAGNYIVISKTPYYSNTPSWTRAYNFSLKSPDASNGPFIKLDTNNDCLWVVSQEYYSYPSIYKIRVIKMDLDGNLELCYQMYESSNFIYLADFTLDSEGSPIISGYTYEEGTTDDIGFVAKLPKTGVPSAVGNFGFYEQASPTEYTTNINYTSTNKSVTAYGGNTKYTDSDTDSSITITPENTYTL